MSEILLNAILHLMALQATMLSAERRGEAREALAAYLGRHLRIARPDTYLELYDTFLAIHEDSAPEELAEHAANVAGNLRSELPLAEQYVLLLRLLELTDLSTRFVEDSASQRLFDVVAGQLAVRPGQVTALRAFRLQEGGENSGREVLRFENGAGRKGGQGRALLTAPDIRESFDVLWLEDVDAFVVLMRDGVLRLDAQPLEPGHAVLLPPGAILRNARGAGIYYNEIAAALRASNLGEESGTPPLVFEGRHLSFRYPGSDNGLHDFHFCLEGGGLVGVMGLSGAGKSTLLSILNGQVRPDSGQVRINGVDLHADSHALEGVIGYVPQDDLLFEDLTVFDNLYYSASLCMAHLGADARRERVDALLEELQQPGTRDLRVGSPLEKTISGGQRKRLNIALELIREPSVLFVDEPTSGLSSSDSENVMALLKAQAAKGRLVIVVIHQPSSRIYKMFDRLWVLDQGGRPIYDGNPLDAILHFRTATHQAGMEEYACPHCGSVRPEQLFEIIEAREVDEGGRATAKRRMSPQAWHERYLAERGARVAEGEAGRGPMPAPERRLWRPGALGQFGLFLARQVKGRLGNRQYLGINLLEPPVLALLAALITRGAWGTEYVFQDNPNIGIYFFISVIVALFLGMSVSAEEICRDRKVLRRERFLHLSRPCYLASKLAYLALVAAVQAALFVWVGNTVLAVPGMYGWTWLVFFSCAMAASVLGLNISDAFRSAVTIYILIPLLLVPQMMLGGAVVPFDQLMSARAGHRGTPLVADIMPSRWGYEALLVRQYVENDYMRPLFRDHCDRHQAAYMMDDHIPEMRALADYPLLRTATAQGSADRLEALRHALRGLERGTGVECGVADDALTPDGYGRETLAQVKACLDRARDVYGERRMESDDRYRALETARREALGRDGVRSLKLAQYNEEVARLAMDGAGFETVRLSGNRLVQLSGPVCVPPSEFDGHPPFLAAEKRIGSLRLSTPLYDVLVLWGMTGLLALALHVRVLPRLVGLGRKRTD